MPAENQTNDRANTSYKDGEPKPWSKVMPWVMLLLVSLLTLYVVGRGCSGDPDEGRAPTATLAAVSLPNGNTLELPETSTEYQLANTLISNAKDINNKFILDDVKFPTGGTSIPESALEQLQTIADILTAFPEQTIQLNGFTEKMENTMAALRLSHRRATEVAKVLSDYGVEKKRMSVLGHGGSNPLVPESSPDAAYHNNRIELKLE